VQKEYKETISEIADEPKENARADRETGGAKRKTTERKHTIAERDGKWGSVSRQPGARAARNLLRAIVKHAA